MGSRGIGILIRDASTHVSAIQIRRDEITEGQSRYHWFSSTFAANDPEKYEGGCGCGSAKDVMYPTSNTQTSCLCITEGRFKSEAIARNGCVSISLQGVSSWKGIESEIKQVMRRRPVKSICLMFDADMTTNKAVFDQSAGLVGMLEKTFPDIKLSYALWPKDKGKGIDDLLNAGNGREMRFVKTQYVTKSYMLIYDALLKRHHAKTVRDVENIEKFKAELQISLERRFFKKQEVSR